MTIYPFRTSVTVASGTAATTSLNVKGGICRQVRIVATTANTTFTAVITDSNGLEVMRYSVQQGEINDITAFPMAGTYTVTITNGSADEVFRIYFAVEE